MTFITDILTPFVYVSSIGIQFCTTYSDLGQGEGQFTDRSISRNFALDPDGKRFAVLKAPEDSEQTGPTQVTIVLNWFDEVRRRVASAGQN